MHSKGLEAAATVLQLLFNDSPADQTWAINVVVMWLTPISGVLKHLVVVPLLIEGKCSNFIVGDVVGLAETLNIIGNLSASFVCILMRCKFD